MGRTANLALCSTPNTFRSNSIQRLGDLGAVAASDPQAHGTVDFRNADGQVNAARVTESAPERASLDGGEERVLDASHH